MKGNLKCLSFFQASQFLYISVKTCTEDYNQQSHLLILMTITHNDSLRGKFFLISLLDLLSEAAPMLKEGWLVRRQWEHKSLAAERGPSRPPPSLQPEEVGIASPSCLALLPHEKFRNDHYLSQKDKNKKY